MRPFDSVSFIGAGRVTRFLLEGWKRADEMPGEIRVSDPNREVLTQLQSTFPQIQPCRNVEAAGAELVTLAVHPPGMKGVFEEIQGAISPDSVVLSLAPKVTTAAIQSALGVRQVVRMIPNAPSAIGQGYNPVSYAAEVPEETVAALGCVFAPWGESPRVPEGDLEVYAIVSAMGPTYMWFQWQILRELAIDFGLTQQATDKAILGMLVGAAGCLLASGKDPLEVMDMVPVKPLKEDEEKILAAYSEKLTALHEKLKAK
ncbi:MAG: pyrroline-5-carboxylate reductase family protein [bacterium]